MWVAVLVVNLLLPQFSYLHNIILSSYHSHHICTWWASSYHLPSHHICTTSSYHLIILNIFAHDDDHLITIKLIEYRLRSWWLIWREQIPSWFHLISLSRMILRSKLNTCQPILQDLGKILWREYKREDITQIEHSKCLGIFRKIW